MNSKLWITWRLVSVLFHLIMLIVYVYALILSEVTYFDRIKGTNEEPWLRDWKFLTRWMILIHITIWTISMVNDIIISQKLIKVITNGRIDLLTEDRSLKISSQLEKFQNFINVIIFSLGVPLGMFVSTTFWILYLSGPGTVLAGESTMQVITHLNHTLPGLAIICEILLIPHEKPSNHRKYLKVLIVFAIIFTLWMFFIFVCKNYWLYPIMFKLNNPQRIGLVAGLYLFLIGFYFLGFGIRLIAWSTKRVSYFENIPKDLLISNSDFEQSVIPMKKISN